MLRVPCVCPSLVYRACVPMPVRCRFPPYLSCRLAERPNTSVGAFAAQVPDQFTHESPSFQQLTGLPGLSRERKGRSMDHAQQQGSPAIVVQPHSAIQEDGGVAVVKSFSCSKSTRSNAPAMSKQEQQQRHEATLSPAPVAVIVEDETSSPSSTSSSDSSSISISMMHDTRGKLEMTKTASGDDKQHHLQTILASPTKQHQDTSSGLGSPERGRQSTRGAALIRQSTPEAISRGGGGTGGASASVTPSPNKRSPPASSRRGNIRSPVPIAFSSGEGEMLFAVHVTCSTK